ncbi:DUF4397 domain-containing protein [Halobacteriaceae archaeon GCM10025711]
MSANNSTVAVVLATLLAASVVFAGVGVAQDEEEMAGVRAVHASPDAPAVDVYLDNESVLTGVEFGTVSDYLDVEPGEHTITVTAADNRSAEVFDGNVTLDAGTNYTVVAAGELSEDANTTFNVSVFVDDAEQPAEGEVAGRVVHLSPDAPAVDVVNEETGDVLVENVSFRNASDYVTVPAGDYTLGVRPTGNDTSVATFDVSLDEQTAYTAFAVGYLDPESAPGDEPFDLVLVEDRTTGAANETMMGEETTAENETEA